jgi:hypothetical protein
MTEYADLPDELVLEKVRSSPAISCRRTAARRHRADADRRVYPIFRRIKLFRWLASNTMWFDFHLMAGVVGPMFICLHSVLHFDSILQSAAF